MIQSAGLKKAVSQNILQMDGLMALAISLLLWPLETIYVCGINFVLGKTKEQPTYIISKQKMPKL